MPVKKAVALRIAILEIVCGKLTETFAARLLRHRPIYEITSVMMECAGLSFCVIFPPSQRLKGCA